MNDDPHPEERRLRRVSKDEGPIVASWFETAQERLLTMRGNTDVGATHKKEGPREAGLETIDQKEKIDQAVLV
jgi:hypothetical protein